jgi:ion channel-forming bestrophin family protein
VSTTGPSYWRRQASFWIEAITIQGSATPLVLGRVAMFGVIALVVTAIDRYEHLPNLGIDVAPYEVAGAALGLLLVLRTNAGYDRWWEARRLWGGIVNQSRNLAIAALAYGPDDPAWRDRFVRRVAAFAHVSRRSLRGERGLPEVAALLGPDEAARIAAAEHMPGAVARALGDDLRLACDRLGMDRFAFLQADRERAALIDHLGGCERILRTPLPRAYTIQIRRFILLFLGMLPFALLTKVGWLTPLITVLVAYPIFSLDHIGSELQDPFSIGRLNHLPLDDICATIEGNLLALLDPGPDAAHPDRSAPADDGQLAAGQGGDASPGGRGALANPGRHDPA